MIFDLELAKYLIRNAIAPVLSEMGPLENVCAWQNRNFQPSATQPYVAELIYVVSEQRVAFQLDRIQGKACYFINTCFGTGTQEGSSWARKLAQALPAADYLRDASTGCALFIQRVERLYEHRHPTLPSWYVHPVEVVWWTHSFAE